MVHGRKKDSIRRSNRVLLIEWKFFVPADGARSGVNKAHTALGRRGKLRLPYGFLSRLTGPNADAIGQFHYEDFPITDTSRFRAFDNGVDSGLQELFGHSDIDSHFFE